MSDYVLSISMIGDKKLQQTLATAGEFAKQELAKALNMAANDARQNAAQLAPHQTGRLRDSIHTENASMGNLRAIVGTKLVYARAQEYGTQGMTIHSHSSRGKQFTYIGNIRPKFYMKQARENVKPKLSGYLQEAARRIVDHIATGN